MRAISVLSDVSFASWAKGLDSVLLAFLHFFIGVGFDARNGLSGVDFIGIDRMSVEVADYFNRVGPALDLNLVRFHSLLDASPNLSQPSIDACLSDTSIRGIFDGSQQIIVGGVECYRKGAVDHSTFDMRPEIDFADIVVSDDGVVSGVGSVVGCHVVEGTACGKSYTRL